MGSSFFLSSLKQPLLPPPRRLVISFYILAFGLGEKKIKFGLFRFLVPMARSSPNCMGNVSSLVKQIGSSSALELCPGPGWHSGRVLSSFLPPSRPPLQAWDIAGIPALLLSLGLGFFLDHRPTSSPAYPVKFAGVYSPELSPERVDLCKKVVEAVNELIFVPLSRLLDSVLGYLLLGWR